MSNSFKRGLSALVAFALSGGCVQAASSRGASSPPLTPADVSKPWTQLYVPEADGTERVIATPHGYFALTRQTLGEPRAPSGLSSYLYRSSDGVRWQQILRHQQELLFGLRGIAYGNGRFVMAGSSGAGSEIWSSSDAVDWEVTKVATAPAQLYRVVFENDRFFVLSTDRLLFTSTDGDDWTRVALPIVGPNSVAFGAGRYVLVGSGPILHSDDGVRWAMAPVNCALPGACISDPDGRVLPGPFFEAVFAERFYVDHLVSSDGSQWQAHADPIAETYVGGYLLGRETERGRWGLRPEGAEREALLAWKPGTTPVRSEVRRQAPPAASVAALASGAFLPTTIDSPLPGGDNCLTRRCVVIDQALYLIP